MLTPRLDIIKQKLDNRKGGQENQKIYNWKGFGEKARTYHAATKFWIQDTAFCCHILSILIPQMNQK